MNLPPNTASPTKAVVSQYGSAFSCSTAFVITFIIASNMIFLRKELLFRTIIIN